MLDRRLFNRLTKHSNWLHRKRIAMGDKQRIWFRGNESLTKQLIKYSDGHFELELLGEYWRQPYIHEARALGVAPHKGCRIREVILKCQGQNTVYARRTISDKAIQASKHQLTKLGTVPLGHLLFKQAKVNLETRQIAKIRVDDQFYFARRTLYELNGEDILVTEYFLKPLW